MESSERKTFRSLQTIFNQAKEHMTARDALFLYQTTNMVTKRLLDADESYVNPSVLRYEAETIMAEIHAFINYREQENWTENSTYLYNTCTEALTKAFA